MTDVPPDLPIAVQGAVPLRRRRAWCLLAFVPLLTAGLGLWVYLDSLRTPEDRLLSELEALVDRLPVRPPPPPPDPDVRLRALEEKEPAAFAAARRAHVPFAFPPGADLHAGFAAFLARWCELDAIAGVHLGKHPHPTSPAGVGPLEGELRALLLFRDAWRELEGRAAGTPHETTDLRLFRAFLAVPLATGLEARDHESLHALTAAVDAIVGLELIDCCPEAERARSAAALLLDLPAGLEALLASLERPARAEVLAAAERLEDGAAHLEELERRWRRHPAFVESCRPAQRALLDARDRLVWRILPRADGAPGIGRAQYELLLRERHQLPFGPEELLRSIVEELPELRRRTGRRLRDLERLRSWPDHEPMPEGLDAHLALIHAHGTDGLERAPFDATPPLSTVLPRAWSRDAAEAFYLSPGPLARSRGLALLRGDMEGPAGDGPYERIRRRHVLTHETSPGHHLQFVYARESACLLRQVYGDEVHQEGWATLAEGPISHQALGPCLGFEHYDRWVLAYEAEQRAWNAALDVLIQAELVAPAQVLAWHRLLAGEETPEVRLGHLAGYPGVLSAYYVGERELERLFAALKAKDPRSSIRAIRERVVRAGPVPPRLVEAELTR